MATKKATNTEKVKKSDSPRDEDAIKILPNNPLASLPIKVSFTYQFHTLCNKKLAMECQEIFIPKEQDLNATKENLKASFQDLTRNLLKQLAPHFTYEKQWNLNTLILMNTYW